MKEIPLTQGKFAIVDDEDYERLSKYKWHACKGGNTFYGYRNSKGLNRHKILMHREILRLKQDDGKHTDHKNHCGLDNKKVNLRICTPAQNQWNRQNPQQGIYFYYKKWVARIKHNGKSIYLGIYSKKSQAINAYQQAQKRLRGAFERGEK